jgi:hypothetical protein
VTQKVHFCNCLGPEFFSEMTPLGVILLRIFPNPENASLTLIQREIWFFNRKFSFFGFLNLEIISLGGNFMREFQGSGMREKRGHF